MNNNNFENKNIEEQAIEVQQISCTATVTDSVCVGADIALTPEVEVGVIGVVCAGDPIIGTCGITPGPCVFTVSQVLDITIPLGFGVGVTATSGTSQCGTPIVTTP